MLEQSPTFISNDQFPVEHPESFNDLEDEEFSEEGNPEPKHFYSNLAQDLPKEKLRNLAEDLISDISSDKESRKQWESTIEIGMKYVGFNVTEFKNKPFMECCSAFDSTMATAIITAYSHARAELFPAAGPCKSEIFGQHTEQLEDQGDRVSSFINYYLTDIDRPYYPDSEKLLMYAISTGSAFRKVWQDPVMKRPLSRTVLPQDFIIDIHTPSLMASTRMTEVVQYSRREIILMQQSGDFIEYELPEIAENEEEEGQVNQAIDRMDGIDPNNSDNKSSFEFYECYVEMDASDIEPDQEGSDDILPRPYIITIDTTTRKVVSIKRNWKEEDEEFSRKDTFVHYYYMPGFGIYGLGLFHLMGSNAITLTSILRQQIDAGTLKNFPGGLKVAGLKVDRNDIAIGPCEFHTIDTGGMPIQQAVMLMPYGEPSTVLMELRNQLIEQTALLGATANLDLPEMGTNAPVGTTLAVLEVQNKVMSTVLRSFHVSLGYELSLLFDLFGEYLPDEPYPFSIKGGEKIVMKQDFNNKVGIVPVSDPNILTTAHRLLLNDSLLRLAQSQPGLYNMVEVNRRMLEAMKVDSIDKILIIPQEVIPLDPISENMNALTGKALKSGLEQDHVAHIQTHMQFQGMPNMAAHIQEHQAMDYYMKMKMEFAKLGMDLPPLEQITDPQMQNEIAMYAAQISMQSAQNAQAQNHDPSVLMAQAAIAEVEQKKVSDEYKDQESRMKAAVELEIAKLRHESEMTKIEAQLEIAAEKNDVDMAIADIKQTKGAK